MSMTLGEAADKLQALGLESDKVITNGIRRALGYWRKETLEGVRSRGIGRAIWGEKKLTTLRQIVARMRVTRSGDNWRSGIKLAGLAALQETGGRTLPHTIRPKVAARLAFMANGKLVMPLAVQHPGSNVPATPSAAPAIPQVEAFLAQTIDDGFRKAIEGLGLS